ncbi:hypothetical protein JB92DRAFT_2860159 [Gautieria morchelliformis]|nr:hypothetical protein JB92DRAFT_2860159 [Gautieria morchelliformis]
MFKRVAKRARKREQEADLGLDEETKQVLGLQDTDSDESLDSNSDSESHSEESDPGSESHGEELDPESELSDVDGPPMSVMAAATDPLYDLPSATSLTTDLRACVICPGKLIKNTQMAQTHLKSKAHLRRLQRYTAEVSKRASSGKGLGTDDPRDILGNMSGSVDYGAPVGTSKRSQRRTQRKDRKAKRRKILHEKKRQVPTDTSK